MQAVEEVKAASADMEIELKEPAASAVVATDKKKKKKKKSAAAAAAPATVAMHISLLVTDVETVGELNDAENKCEASHSFENLLENALIASHNVNQHGYAVLTGIFKTQVKTLLYPISSLQQCFAYIQRYCTLGDHLTVFNDEDHPLKFSVVNSSTQTSFHMTFHKIKAMWRGGLIDLAEKTTGCATNPDSVRELIEAAKDDVIEI